MAMPGMPNPTGVSSVPGVSTTPMGPNTGLGTPQMQIRNMSTNKPAAPTLDAAAAADPQVQTPYSMLPAPPPAPNGMPPTPPPLPNMPPPAPPMQPQMMVRAAAELLHDNRDLIDRFVDKVLRKV